MTDASIQLFCTFQYFIQPITVCDQKQRMTNRSGQSYCWILVQYSFLDILVKAVSGAPRRKMALHEAREGRFTGLRDLEKE